MTLFGPPSFSLRSDEAPMICRMIFDELCVLANGDIVCSCGDPAAIRVFGNVRRDRIADVYDGRLYRKARRRQLAAQPDSYCPVIKTFCGGRVSRAGVADSETGRSVKMLQLEPISFCNLKCPRCPVTQFFIDPAYRVDRAAVLPLAVMEDVVAQLPDLEKLLFFNFGEPFLHREAVPFLRYVRRNRPEVLIHTSTNAIPLDASKIEALVAARERAGTRDRLEIHWQYILFEWNDSDSEIGEARARAKDIGVPLKWVFTHTPGASLRFRHGSPEAARLFGDADPYEALTCDLKMQHFWKHRGLADDIYHARLETGRSELRARAGGRAGLNVTIQNRSGSPWIASGSRTFRLGVKLRTSSGRFLKELGGIALPGRACRAGGSAALLFDLPVPSEPGRYELVFDVVEEGVCWFSDRGSPCTTIPLVVEPADSCSWDPAPLVELAHRVHLGRSPGPEELSFCSKELLRGTPLEVISLHVAAGAPQEESAREARLAAFRGHAAAFFAEEPAPV